MPGFFAFSFDFVSFAFPRVPISECAILQVRGGEGKFFLGGRVGSRSSRKMMLPLRKRCSQIQGDRLIFPSRLFSFFLSLFVRKRSFERGKSLETRSESRDPIRPKKRYTGLLYGKGKRFARNCPDHCPVLLDLRHASMLYKSVKKKRK